METINVTNARTKLFGIVDLVNENHEPVKILGKRGDAVILSADDWKAIEETMYIMSVPGLADDLKKSFSEPLEDMVNADEVEW